MRPIKSAEEYRGIIFQIMIYLDELAKKHGLHCFLSGGTLLGAVRHQGFIPWDDDADMMLLRKDYEQLIKLINQDDSPYRALRIQNDRGYYYSFAKVVDTRTYLRQSGCVPIANNGICVDLFPIDDLPNDADKIRRHFYIQKKLREPYQRYYNVSTKDENNRLILFINRTGMRMIARLLEYRARRYRVKNPKYAACSVMGYHMKEIMPKKELEETTEVIFEGRAFLAPAGYKRYLTHLYGDYMTPPPRAKRYNEHMAKAWYR